MKIFKSVLFLSLLLNISSTVNAQMLDKGNPRIFDEGFKEYAAVIYNGAILLNDDSPDGPLRLDSNATGKIKVATVDRTFDKSTILEDIGFKVGIINYRTNTLWMYSSETLFELDIQEVSNKCEFGDRIIIMMTDRRYYLPRHEIQLNIGC